MPTEACAAHLDDWKNEENKSDFSVRVVRVPVGQQVHKSNVDARWELDLTFVADHLDRRDALLLHTAMARIEKVLEARFGKDWLDDQQHGRPDPFGRTWQ
jgi:hypothetical protein